MLVKEEVIDFLVRGKVRVSRQDFQFFTNLQKIAREKRVTTGQSNLLNKLLDKYKRQIEKQGFKSEDLQLLSWNHTLVETKFEYQQAHLSLTDEICLRTPFSKKFINELNKFENQNFKILHWDKQEKLYRGDSSNFALKNLLPILYECFDNVRLCDNITSIVNDVKQYENYIFDPTLVRSNGNYYIIACNESLAKQLNHIDLNDSANCLFLLSTLGIKIHKDITDDDKKKFVSEFMPTVDMIEIEKIAQYLNELGVDTVFASASLVKQLEYVFTRYHVKMKTQDTLLSESNMHKHIVYLQVSSSRKSSYFFLDSISVSKIIIVKNSKPVNVL